MALGPGDPVHCGTLTDKMAKKTGRQILGEDAPVSRTTLVLFPDDHDGWRSGAFFEAAQVLSEHVRQHAISGYDRRRLLPICFCYRHYLEVALKRSVRLAEEYIEAFGLELRCGSVLKELTRTHSLRNLIEWLSPRVELTPFRPVQSQVQDAVLAVDKIDQKGFTFRYQAGTDGETPTLDRPFIRIDLNLLEERMAETREYLDHLQANLEEETRSRIEQLGLMSELADYS